MVRIQVQIAECVDKLPCLHVANVGDHLGEQRVRCDVEGHSQEEVCAALVELA